MENVISSPLFLFFLNYRLFTTIVLLCTSTVISGAQIECDEHGCSITELDGSTDRPELPITTNNLSITSSNISTLPVWVGNFTQLKILHVTNSSLVNFALEASTTVNALNLSQNLIKILTRNMLQAYSSLQLLNLSCNQISSIEDYAFTGSSSIVSLDLAHNRLRKLSAPLSARPLLDLKILRLDNNRLEELSEDLFDTLIELKLLSLTGNYLKIITERTVRPLYHLEELRLQDNHLRSVAFENPRLIRLNLGRNDLAADDISGLSRSRLQELNLSRNPIGNVTALNLDELELLETLTMNKMTLLSFDTFNGPKTLRILSFKGNDYVNISSIDLSHMSRLNLLQIDGNQLKNIEIKYLPASLTYIGLNDNQFDCTYLEELLDQLRLKGIRLYLTNDPIDTTEQRKFIQGVICISDELEGVVIKACKILEEDFVYAWHTSLATAVCLALAVVYIYILWRYRHELKKIKDHEYNQLEAEEEQTLTFHDLLSKDQNDL